MAHAPFTMPSRYEEVHKVENTAGPGDARPTGLQILKDENRLDGSLANKVVVITGCSSGIGVPTVKTMAAAGCTVYGGVRPASITKAREALSSILNNTKDSVHILEIDMTNLASIKAFADEIKKREKVVNILINNAGVMATPRREVTEDGFEMQLGTNHLGHFYLFQNLRDNLLAGAKASLPPNFASRVISLGSVGYRFATVSFDDINAEKEGSYSPGKAYGQSKTAVLWMANHVERLYGSRGVHGYTCTPGGVATALQRHVRAQMDALRDDARMSAYMKSVDQGSATTVWAATARVLEGRGGVYCEDCGVAGAAQPVNDGYPHLAPGYAGGWAFSPEGEERLWKVSNAMVGLEEGA